MTSMTMGFERGIINNKIREVIVRTNLVISFFLDKVDTGSACSSSCVAVCTFRYVTMYTHAKLEC